MSERRRWDGHRLVWIVLGLVLAAAAGFALYQYVGAVLFAIFLYYATRPVNRRLDRNLDHPNVATSVTILLVVLPMLAIVAYAGFVALRELDQFLAASDLEPLRSALDPYLSLARQGEIGALRDALSTGTGSIGSLVQQRLPGAFQRLSSAVGFVFGVLASFFLMITFLFYLLRDDWKIRRWFARSVDHDEAVVSFLDTVDDDLEVIFVGNLAVVGVAAVFAAVSYYGLNLVAPGGTVVVVPVLLSLLIGIGTLIPAVGMKIVYVPYGLYLLGLALATAAPLWHPIAFFVVSFTIVDTIPDFFARSFLSARSGVHMGLVLLGYFLGTLTFGWYGLFLGPIVVVLLVHFADDIFPDLARTLLAD